MILIVDFGSQTAHLIGRRLRQIGVDYRLCEAEDVIEVLGEKKYSGIIFSGGPASVYEEGSPMIDPKVFDMRLPILGICYGWQLMAHFLEGGEVRSGQKEYGPEALVLENNKKFDIDEKSFTVFMSHGDTVMELPKGFEVFASTASTKNAGVWNQDKKMMGLQFHPEAHHTEHGLDFLTYFIHQWCQEEIAPFELKPEEIIKDVKEKVGEQKVICAVSGGVDSTVAAFLIGKAIGHNLIPVYVKSGLMREGTEDWVRKIFTEYIDADLIVVEAEERFMMALKGKVDPEEKRKIIGGLYVEIFQEIAKKHPEAKFLGQGTIYSDVIESKGSKRASHIKSHHNVGGLPEDMHLKLIEPMRNYYKDEVREIGKMVGLPEEIVWQQPLPGPGNAVRIRGEVTKKRLKQIRIADNIIEEEMRAAKLWRKAFQCFPVMTGAYSTAVKGDARAFSEVVALRAYESKDIMTAGWMHIPYEVLQKISSRIVNEVPDVSRVVYDITSKPPATMEWE